ncbi:MAG: PilT/PilU family type 4a pilus ATPase [Thermodesulfovibrionales bacterium]|nr:PilT/PilU family type 4a pilus ATPase [Thermodesulfovibrionales bacterium]
MLIDLLTLMIQKEASDLHITTGARPRIRRGGHLVDIEEYPILTPEDTKKACYSILSDSQIERFEKQLQIDLSFGIKGLSRFRANIFIQRGAVTGVFRAIPFNIKPLNELGLPKIVSDLALKGHGLVIISGQRSSGKSTTLASMIDFINNTRQCHIITIEDPLEFLHSHKKALVNQREIDTDTTDIITSIRSALRQDPDVLMIADLENPQVTELAITAAESGHLVLTSMTSSSTLLTIKRIIEQFPPHQQEQIRFRLSFVLEGIVCQQLLSRKDGKGIVPACEILLATPAVRNLIKEDNTKQVYSLMQTMGDMQTMNQSLFELYEKKHIDKDTALSASYAVEELNLMISKGGLKR